MKGKWEGVFVKIGLFVILLGGVLVLGILCLLPSPTKEKGSPESDKIIEDEKISRSKNEKTGKKVSGEKKSPQPTDPRGNNRPPKNADGTKIKPPKSSDIPKEPSEETIPKLIEKLRHKDWRIRSKTSRELIKKGKAAIPELVKALKDEETPLLAREKIIVSLGRIGEEARKREENGIEDPRGGIEDPEAADSSIEDPEVTGSLIDQLNHENAYIRRCAAEALGRIGDTGAVDALISALKDKDGSVRMRAADALGKIKDGKALEPLIESLSDEDQRVFVTTIRSLGSIGDKRATEPLLQELASDHAQIHKDVIAFTLGELKDKSALPGLKKHLEELKKKEPPKGTLPHGAWEFSVKMTEEAISKLEKTQ